MKLPIHYLSFLKRKKYFIFSNLVIFALLLQFNNCSENKSGMKEQASNAPLNSNGTPSPSPNPNPGSNSNQLNPYILQCINSSDAKTVSKTLNASVLPAASGASGKISSLDWNQDEDLVVTIDNKCIRASHFGDAILKYVSADEIRSDMSLTVYVIKKESVTNLKLFIATALESECLLAADKNIKMQVSADVADPRFSSLAHLANIGATDAYLASIMAYNGGALYKTKVAVIDTGVDSTNPDLTNNIARDSSGQIIGFNAITRTSPGDTSDAFFHGTHVSGLIGAEFRNGVTVSGVYGRNIAIYPIRASDDGQTLQTDDVANGLIWAADKGVDLVNMSLGSKNDSPVMKNAISYAISKNVMIVVAAGNGDSTGKGQELGVGITAYPAMYSNQFSGLITVGSIDATSNVRSSFSNYSPTYVDIMAPGSNGTTGILSTVPMVIKGSATSGIASAIATTNSTTGTTSVSPIHGTSMATPVVTGALAAAISMAKSKNYPITNSELETIIRGEGSLKSSAYTTFAANGSYLSLPTLLNYVKDKAEAAATPTTPTADALSIITQPVSKQVVVGETFDISVTVVSSPTATYQWYQNGTKIIGATSAKFTFNQVTTAQAGAYTVEVTAGSKKLVSQKAEIKVALKYCN